MRESIIIMEDQYEFIMRKSDGEGAGSETSDTMALEDIGHKMQACISYIANEENSTQN